MDDTTCTRIRSVAARSSNDLAALAVRGPYEEVVLRDGWESTESWIVRRHAGVLSCSYRTSDVLSALCLDVTGAIWATTHHHVVRIADGTEPSYVALDVSPTCIASTNDGRVFCGGAVLGESNRVWEIANGRAVELAALPEEIHVLHVLGNTLFAAGHGFCSRWDGRAWLSLGEIDDTLHRLHAVRDDELYAAAKDSEQAYRHHDGTWTVLSEDHPVEDIAVWGGAVWIAAGEAGLLCDGQRVFDLIENAHTLVAGNQLIVAADEMVVATADGQLDDVLLWSSDIERLPAAELPAATSVD